MIIYFFNKATYNSFVHDKGTKHLSMHLSGQRNPNEILHLSKYYSCVLKLSTSVGFSE